MDDDTLLVFREALGAIIWLTRDKIEQSETDVIMQLEQVIYALRENTEALELYIEGLDNE